MYPEGMVKLNGGAGEVLKRVDGKNTVADIVADIKRAFPDVPDLEGDVMAMLELAREKVWIERKTNS